MNAPAIAKVTVRARHEASPSLVLLELDAPCLLGADAGQFVQVVCRDPSSRDPLLRRPFSLAGDVPERGTVRLLVKATGRGSTWLASRQVGQAVDVFGPLGHGLRVDEQDAAGGSWLLVGGGSGVAPLVPLAQRLAATHGARVEAVLGFRTGAEAVLEEEIERAGARVSLATEDGSRGWHGTAVALAARRWDGAARVFACGPWPMLHALEALRRESPRRLWVAVETTMACGAGVCLSCVVPWGRREGYRNTGWARACVDGPVFEAEDLIWERCPGAP